MKIAAFVAWVVVVAPATLQPLAGRDNKPSWQGKKKSKWHKRDKISTIEVTHPLPPN